jgi:uncharacterized repeat protein (TIGR01451 family)
MFSIRFALTKLLRLGAASLLGAAVLIPLSVGVFGGVASAAPIAPPFGQCPAIGLDTSCALLIDATGGGTSVLQDSTQGPYDGVEDTLLGVINQTTAPITSLALSSTTEPLFGFDGDGICTFTFASAPATSTVSNDKGSASCPYGAQGYEGPDTSFSGISADLMSGTLNFSPALAPGKSTYFSLEEPLNASQISVGGTDLAVSLTNRVSTLKAGRSMTYCATATNNGPLTATNVLVMLSVPAGLTITNPEGGVVSGNTITWTVPKLLAGKHANFKAVVHDVATSGSTLTATAIVSGAQPDPVPANNSATSVTTIK